MQQQSVGAPTARRWGELPRGAHATPPPLYRRQYAARARLGSHRVTRQRSRSSSAARPIRSCRTRTASASAQQVLEAQWCELPPDELDRADPLATASVARGAICWPGWPRAARCACTSPSRGDQRPAAGPARRRPAPCARTAGRVSKRCGSARRARRSSRARRCTRSSTPMTFFGEPWRASADAVVLDHFVGGDGSARWRAAPWRTGAARRPWRLDRYGDSTSARPTATAWPRSRARHLPGRTATGPGRVSQAEVLNGDLERIYRHSARIGPRLASPRGLSAQLPIPMKRNPSLPSRTRLAASPLACSATLAFVLAVPVGAVGLGLVPARRARDDNRDPGRGSR